MNAKELNKLWGDELFVFFADDFTEDGYLTQNWCDIVDERVPSYSLDDYKSEKNKSIYTRMSMTEFEHSECGNFIRPKENSFV